MTAEAPGVDALLTVRDLVKEFSGGALRVLDGVSLDLRAGESVAVTGPSGSGKSTLLHILGTLDSPTSGTVVFDGRDVHGLPPDDAALFRNSEIGFVFQDHHLMPQLTAVENVLLPALAFGRADEARRARAMELLDAVGLAHRRDHFPSEMSGGQCQRVAIARSLVNLPKLVLCDEPTGDLDAATGEEVARLLLDSRDLHGVALVVVTHNERLAGAFGRRLRLEGGRLA